jgi:chemotaxis protein CheZ
MLSLTEAQASLQRAMDDPALSASARAELSAVAGSLQGLEARTGEDERGTAQAELVALRQETEKAVEKIMDAAEAMLAQARDGGDLTAVVRLQALAVLEACSFQDITGQRVSKIARIIDELDARESGAPAREETDEERRRRELVLNGPAIGGPALDQDAVDAMFD